MHVPTLGSDAPEAIELGRLVARNGLVTHKIRSNDERHLVLFGGNGMGKGTRILMPNLLNMRGNRSIVVVDPKGELAAVTAPFRRQVGRVVIINPFGVLTEYQGYEDMRGVGFNPLAALDPDGENFDSDVGLLADALVPMDDKQTPHWNNSARALVSAIIMYVVLIARKNGKIPTMARVRELICMDSEAPQPKTRLLPATEGKGIPKLAAVMMRSSRVGLRNLAAQFLSWNNEISSIASTLKVQTRSFDEPQIARNMAQDDFDFRDLKREPTTVYLVLPPEMLRRHGKWLRLALTTALQANMRVREKHEPRILFMLDEFAALGHLEIIDDLWATVRGYGIQIMPVFQDLPQVKTIYGDNKWETFIANAHAVMSFRPNDMTTRKWISEALGDTTQIMKTMSEAENESWGQNSGQSIGQNGVSQSGGANSGGSLSRTFSTSLVKVPRISPHALGKLPDGYMITLINGVQNGMITKAPPYHQIISRRDRARDNPYFHGVTRRRDSSTSDWSSYTESDARALDVSFFDT